MTLAEFKILISCHVYFFSRDLKENDRSGNIFLIEAMLRLSFPLVVSDLRSETKVPGSSPAAAYVQR